MSVEFRTVDEFLEHHGTKGMRWGVRKQRSISDASRTGRTKAGKKLTRQQRKLVNRRHGLSTGQKVAIGVGVVGVIGAAFVARKLMQNRGMTLKNARSATNLVKSAKQTNAILKSSGGLKLSEIRKPVVSGMNPFKNPVGLMGKL